VRPLFGVAASGYLHAENRKIPVARLGVVWALIRDVVDTQYLEPARRLRVGSFAGGVNERGERNGLAELAAVEFAAVKSLTRLAMNLSIRESSLCL